MGALDMFEKKQSLQAKGAKVLFVIYILTYSFFPPNTSEVCPGVAGFLVLTSNPRGPFLSSAVYTSLHAKHMFA